MYCILTKPEDLKKEKGAAALISFWDRFLSRQTYELKSAEVEL